MPADLATTPHTPPAPRPAAAFAQFPTAWRFALRNQARNRLAGLLLVVFVPAWYLLMAALTGHQTLRFRLFATGQVLAVDGRHLTLITAGLNALTLITGFAVFAAIRKTVAFDQRLVFAGYRQPTLIAAKTAAIAVIAAAIAGYTAVVLLAFWRPSLPGWLAILAAFTVIALTYGALGLLLGVLPGRQQAHPGMAPLLRPHAIPRRRSVRPHRAVEPPRPRPGLDRRLHHRGPAHLPHQDPQPPAPRLRQPAAGAAREAATAPGRLPAR
jgi:hypothetical protein